MARKVLVLGSKGNFGAAAAAAFWDAGWEVSAYARGTDMAAAARGADLIVNGLNPPMYHDWANLIPQITSQVIAAAQASGARVQVPGNIYVFGDQPGPWDQNTPHRPNTAKGRIRAAMEARYRDTSGLRTTFLRAGDFMAENNPNTIFNMAVLRSVAKGRISAMGRPDAPRAYAYLPDLGRAAVAVATLNLPDFADIPFAGHSFSIADVADEIGQLTGKTPKITGFPWWALRMAGPFWEVARELTEMRYLYDLPHSLSGALFAELVPDFRATPFRDIIAAHLVAKGVPLGQAAPKAVLRAA